MTGKLPYRVPLVAEVRTQPRNGLKVASTFSGCGGSSFGYEMAGYEVVWANEMVPEARACYQANHPDTLLDSRNIRTVQAQEVLDAIGLEAGELDLLDGSPPCQSFSTAGKREQGWNKVGSYADGTHQMSDDLFFEYARLLEGLRPRTFVAENVAGLVKGTAKGYFKLILRRLRECGYRVQAKVLDAQWLGVPQHRQRLIFVGIRGDLGLKPVFPQPLPYRYSAAEALDRDTVKIEGANGFNGHAMADHSNRPAPTVQAGRAVRVVYNDGYRPGRPSKVLDGPSPTIRAGRAATLQVEERRMSIAELCRICGFPDDYVLTGSYAEQWARLGNAVPPPMMAAVAAKLRDAVLLQEVAA